MLDLVGRSAVATHEDVFLARYRALVLVALRITDGHHSEAEDLVHEAFIRFTLVQPPLDEVQHLDAYLSRMLRNMYTSRIRRRQRAAETSLSILDYDSLDIGFHAMDASGQLEVREMLRAACEYGCIRKRSSKAGSVFLLRFFHGYLPSEIASLSRLSSGIVDALVFRARREVRAYVEDPNQLAFIDRAGRVTSAAPTPVERRVNSTAGRSLEPGIAGTHQPERAFMDELRTRIFNDTHDRCWSKKVLRTMYGDRSAEALSRDDLADLVGCSTCLDAAGVLLGLPRLADRWPVDTLGPGSRGGPSGGSAATGTVTSGRRRARAVFEHRPRELRVSVNGFILGSHTIGADPSELTLSVNLNEPIASIELLTEQDLCLAFLDISPPPDGNARQRRRVELSDGRHAQIEVTFASPWPSVRASYSDPRPRFSAHTETELAGEGEDVTETQVVLEIPRRRPRLFQSKPAWVTALLVIAIWLLFWTPGTSVSAAERIVDTIRWLVSAVFASESPGVTHNTAPSPPTPTARDISLPPVSTMPVKPAKMDGTRRTYLELKALAELQHVHAYLGQELSFTSRDGTTVQLRGLVDTNARKSALLGALGPLLGDHDLQARITNVNEIPQRRPSRVETESRTFAFTRDRFPLFEDVRRYVLSQQQRQHEESGATGPLVVDDVDLDARTQRFAMQLLDRSRRASQHAWALKHLGDHFSRDIIGAASPDTREIWQTIVREHARTYGQELALLRRDLEPVIRILDPQLGARDMAERGSAVDDGSTTWAEITRLHEAHRRQDQAIQDGFANQSGANDDVDGVQTAAFWTLMDVCEALAAKLTRD